MMKDPVRTDTLPGYCTGTIRSLDALERLRSEQGANKLRLIYDIILNKEAGSNTIEPASFISFQVLQNKFPESITE